LGEDTDLSVLLLHHYRNELHNITIRSAAKKSNDKGCGTLETLQQY